MSTSISVVLAGGGTAGHIEPALALADALRREDPDVAITCLGTERGLETRLVPQRGYELALIPPVPLPRALTPRLLTVPGRLRGAINAAASVLDRVRADVLVGFGGYVAPPGYLAARNNRVPIVVHEANPRPGLANRLGARFTDHVAVAHPDTPLPHARYVGIPLRREIAHLDRLSIGDKARGHFGLRSDLPTLLVFGGSQGARSLNRAVAGAALAMCRAGAMTCAELPAVGLPAAYVPLPHGNGEQRLNAQPIVDAGGGLLVEDAELTPEWIRRNLVPVLSDTELIARMSEAAARMGRRDADVALARMVFEVGAGRAAS